MNLVNFFNLCTFVYNFFHHPIKNLWEQHYDKKGTEMCTIKTITWHLAQDLAQDLALDLALL